jgi:hypothetical protein
VPTPPVADPSDPTPQSPITNMNHLRLPITALPTDYSATPGPTDRIRARVRELLYRASRELDTSVTGARGEELTVNEAVDRVRAIDNQIQMDEVRGSKRHRRVSPAAKISSMLFLGFIDFPIMLWLASSVFNVDWGDPLGLQLLISTVVSLLATGGSAAALYHLGHNLRDSKNYHGGLSWNALSFGSKLSLIGVTLLVSLISVVMLLRVYSEGILSGISDLAFPLALLVSFVMLISASLVFWTAFRDGSPEQDDLVYYSKIVQRHRQIKRQYEDEAVELTHQCDLMERQN